MNVVQERAVSYLNHILLSLATSAAMGAAYPSWDDKFARKEVQAEWTDDGNGLRKQRQRRLTVAELRTISEDDLTRLCFSKWDDSGLRLIPLWAFN